MRGRTRAVGILPLLVAVVASLLPAAAITPAVAATGSQLSGTWFLTSRDQLRLEAPPGRHSAQTTDELAELLRLQRHRTAAQVKIAKRWNAGPATVRWTRLMLRMIRNHQPSPAVAARQLALFHTGMYDALVAAADTQRAYADTVRPKPAVLEPRLDPLFGRKRGSSDVPGRVAIAGAAAEILKYLYPNEPPRTFDEAAEAASESRLWAGVSYRSDVERALALGHAVADLVKERAANDGFTNSTPAHPRPAGEAYWSPTAPTYITPPIGGAVGTWKPWLMDSPDQLRSVLPGPSTYGSEQFMTNLHEVLDIQTNLTPAQKDTAFFWDDGSGSLTPPGHWFDIALEQVAQYRTGTRRTARIMGLLGAVEGDSAIAFFEAKFYWWSIRPITAIWRLCDGDTVLCTESEASSDPQRAPHYDNWLPLIVTPSFPSYPSGHATFSGAAGALLTHMFPQSGETLGQLADDAAMSRLYGGIHFREDNDGGLMLGRALADLAIEWDESGGATP